MVRSEQVPTRGATGRTWERRPAERRGELLDAAEHLFAERGIANVTVSDIVGAAGVSKGSFYGYFAAKDDLVEALNERFGAELFTVLDDVLDTLVESGARSISDQVPFDATTLRALLEDAVERMVLGLLARRDLLEIWSREPSVVGRSIEWLPRFVDRLAPFMTGVHSDTGPVTCSDPTTTSLLVVHGIFGAVVQGVLQEGDIDPAVLVRSSQELATRAFGLA